MLEIIINGLVKQCEHALLHKGAELLVDGVANAFKTDDKKEILEEKPSVSFDSAVQPSTNNNGCKSDREKFYEYFNWCAENMDEAINTYDDVKRHCMSLMAETESPIRKATWLYLLAWINLERFCSNDSMLAKTEEEYDKSIKSIKETRDNIKKAINLVGSDREYETMLGIYSFLDYVYNEDHGFDEEMRYFSHVSKDFFSCSFEDSLLNPDYILNLWERASCLYFNDIAYFGGKASDIQTLVKATNYAESDTELHKALYVYRIYWMDTLASHYIQGKDCPTDYNAALQLLYYTAEKGSIEGKLMLADMNVKGQGVGVNLNVAKKYYAEVVAEADPESDNYKLAGKKLDELMKGDHTKGKSRPSTSSNSSTSQGSTALANNDSLHGESFPNREEEEYADMVKELLTDGEISNRERKLLEKLRTKLSISEKRANEIERFLIQPQLTEEEQDYLDEYREMKSEGTISSRERKLLNKIAVMSGISSERAAELERMD